MKRARISGFTHRTRSTSMRFFSCQEVGATSQTYQLTFEDDEDFMDYINNAFEKSVVESKVKVGADDKVVTLSTCTGNDTTRFIVQGKLINTYLSK